MDIRYVDPRPHETVEKATRIPARGRPSESKPGYWVIVVRGAKLLVREENVFTWDDIPITTLGKSKTSHKDVPPIAKKVCFVAGDGAIRQNDQKVRFATGHESIVPSVIARFS